MTLGDNLRKSYRDLQQGWARLADAIGKSSAGDAEDMARGEFISPFISEGGLSFPRPVGKPARTPR